MDQSRLKRKGIGKTTEMTMKKALYLVFEGGWSVKRAALQHGIPRTTFRRYVAKCREAENIDFSDINLEGAPRLTPNYEVNRVFSKTEEEKLTAYLKNMANLHYGLTPKQVRSFAYDLAVAYGKKIPEYWNKNKCAGKNWFFKFMKRNETISIRRAEATSLARAMGFNKPVVAKFFSNLSALYEKYKYTPAQIYNVDETGLTTVQGSSKVVATKGQKQIGQITSSERGTLVTMIGAINAIGNSIPPFLIFPRKNFKPHMIKGGPPGVEGEATPSGWVNKDVFLKWFEFFIKHARPSAEYPVLLLMDNHESHISLDIIKMAKKHNVQLLTLPPHTSHKLQPLDKSVYGPLKRHYNNECNNWLSNHPGQRITIYDVSEILGQAYPHAFSTNNIISAFKNTGICPINDLIYDDSEYLPASVTDQPLQEDVSVSPRAGPSTKNVQVQPRVNELQPSDLDFSPENVAPYPKATISKKKTGNRKKKSTEILTSTPFLEKLQAEVVTKRSDVKRRIFENEDDLPSRKTPPPKRAKLENKDVSSSDEDNVSDNISFASSTLTESFQDELVNFNQLDDIKINSFILIKFCTKKSEKYYVAQVTNIHSQEEEFTVSYLRNKKNKFVFPLVPDISTVSKDDIELVLPDPSNTGGTIRMANSFSFHIDLSGYNIC